MPGFPPRAWARSFFCGEQRQWTSVNSRDSCRAPFDSPKCTDWCIRCPWLGSVRAVGHNPGKKAVEVDGEPCTLC